MQESPGQERKVLRRIYVELPPSLLVPGSNFEAEANGLGEEGGALMFRTDAGRWRRPEVEVCGAEGIVLANLERKNSGRRMVVDRFSLK